MTPETLIDYLKMKLAEALASRRTEAEKIDFLAYAEAAWIRRYTRFAETEGDSEVPHPIYGMPTAFDFALIIAEIRRRQSQTMREAA